MLERKLTQGEIKVLVDKAMLELPKDDFELIYELFFEHRSVHKLADKLSISHSALRYRRDKALALLKQKIEEVEE
ncbi:MAG: hypothetical protein ACP5SB_00410 [Caldisericaceae bacterium]